MAFEHEVQEDDVAAHGQDVAGERHAVEKERRDRGERIGRRARAGGQRAAEGPSGVRCVHELWIRTGILEALSECRASRVDACGGECNARPDEDAPDGGLPTGT